MTYRSDDSEARLLAIFRALHADDRHALQAYAEFLAVRGGMRPTAAEATVSAEPAPEGETVVMAIKRLTRTYPMIERRRLIGRTSQLMAEHALQGRAAVEVIAELEVVFEEHFRKTVQRET
jgi:hypothetical protein